MATQKLIVRFRKSLAWLACSCVVVSFAVVGCNFSINPGFIDYCTSAPPAPFWTTSVYNVLPSQYGLRYAYIFSGTSQFGETLDKMVDAARKNGIDEKKSFFASSVDKSMREAVYNFNRPDVIAAYENLGGKKQLLINFLQSSMSSVTKIIDYWYDCEKIQAYTLLAISFEDLYANLSKNVVNYKFYFLPSLSDQDAIVLSAMFIQALQRNLYNGRPFDPYIPPVFPPYPPYPGPTPPPYPSKRAKNGGSNGIKGVNKSGSVVGKRGQSVKKGV